jgi:hypothetical protein
MDQINNDQTFVRALSPGELDTVAGGNYRPLMPGVLGVLSAGSGLSFGPTPPTAPPPSPILNTNPVGFDY